MEMGTLSGKVAVVTGANRGIGRAIAGRLAQDGAKVILAARNQELLETAVTEIQGGGEAAAIALDLREPDAAEALVTFASEQFGGVDIIVNNAGATKRGEFLELSEQDWEDGFALKFFGYVRLSRAAWPKLRESNGAVLNIIGVGGRTPGTEFSIGGSVNGALITFTKSLAALGIRDGVRVNAINPGSVRTDRLTQQLVTAGLDPATGEEELVRKANIVRIGEPEDVASLAAFVLGPSGTWLQGSIIDLDGGATKSV